MENLTLAIDTVKFSFPLKHYDALKNYFSGNGYKLRADNNKYITNAFYPSIKTTMLKIYQAFNPYDHNCYVEIYGLKSYNEILDSEKKLIVKLIMNFIEENGLSNVAKINSIDIALDFKTPPAEIKVLRDQSRGRPVKINENIYDNDWFQKNSLYLEGHNFKKLRYKNEDTDKLLVSIEELENIVRQKIENIDEEFKKQKAKKIRAFKTLFKENALFYLEGDYFYIKKDLLSQFDLSGYKFSFDKPKNVSFAYLYDKSNKERLEAPLSRFEIKVCSKDIKGEFDGLNGRILAIIRRYRILLSGKEVNLADNGLNKALAEEMTVFGALNNNNIYIKYNTNINELNTWQ